MSLNSIKAKQTKGKQKSLPKLKAILANPNKKRCPVLEEKEMEHLKFLLQNAIQESGIEPRKFATQKGICLGLESSLRKINNQTSGCVFISLSIKPNHIIGLIARNAELKDGTQPVYAQPKLENFVIDIFGVHAIAMVFPKDMLAVSGKLNKWVQERKKPARFKKTSVAVKKTLKKKLKQLEIVKSGVVNMSEKSQTKVETVPKKCSDDFISFSQSREIINYKDADHAVDALSEIMDNIPTSTAQLTKCTLESEPMEVDNSKNLETITKETTQDDDSDSTNDFIGEYKALKVHKIKGNPNKNSKKKRKKNKKKNQAK